MNELTLRLREETRKKEQEAQAVRERDHYRLKHHLQPKAGWLNDPNGLCQKDGLYHVFYQYSPLNPRGGMKGWGHSVTRDFLHWESLPMALFPDMPFDKDGVYSGSAFLHDGTMYLFYTGNVKQEGDHDYVRSGREANTVLVRSRDGKTFEEKELLMTNADYPADYTCHIRDPKLWEENGKFFMIQGGRKLEDKGSALIFGSEDLRNWKFDREVTTREPFGYMWECPDYFRLDGAHVFSFSPQGLPSEELRFQNVYQSGYAILPESPAAMEAGTYLDMKEFREWDYGFDFYAPQSFEDEKGRRILMGWVGIPDADYDNEPTIERGWQHALTLPRELTLKNGRVYQNPVEELAGLRDGTFALPANGTAQASRDTFEILLTPEAAGQAGQAAIACGTESVTLSWDGENILRLRLSGGAGRGRKERRLKLERLESLRIMADTSLLEVYVNGGEAVLTTRFYFPGRERIVGIKGAGTVTGYYLAPMEGI